MPKSRNTLVEQQVRRLHEVFEAAIPDTECNLFVVLHHFADTSSASPHLRRLNQIRQDYISGVMSRASLVQALERYVTTTERTIQSSRGGDAMRLADLKTCVASATTLMEFCKSKIHDGRSR